MVMLAGAQVRLMSSLIEHSSGPLVVAADDLRAVLDALKGFQQAEKIGIPECKKCHDTGSLRQNGYHDCHYCGRADENVRVLSWFAQTMLGNNEEQDVLMIYHHGKQAGLAEARRKGALQALVDEAQERGEYNHG